MPSGRSNGHCNGPPSTEITGRLARCWQETEGRNSRFREILRKARSLDPELVESVSSLPCLRQGLFHICTRMRRTLEKAERRGLPVDSAGVLKVMQEAYKESQNERGRLNSDEYIRRVAPAPAIPMEGKSILLYELVEAFKSLLFVYGNFTGPILNPPRFLSGVLCNSRRPLRSRHPSRQQSSRICSHYHP